MNVTTSKSLREYLCPQNRTIPPNTDVIISVPVIDLDLELPGKFNDEQFCLIENTTNITISSSWNLMNSEPGYAKVRCFREAGFGFFNVTNLTVRSVHFEYCSSVVPPAAVKYLNESDQILYYNDVMATLIFNHCCNLTLSQVLVLVGTFEFSIIGANLCGTSTVQLNDSELSLLNFVKKTMLFYFTDSPISPLFPKYDLYIQSNISGSSDCSADDIQKYFATQPVRIKISSVCGTSLYLTQQHFDVNVSI